MWILKQLITVQDVVDRRAAAAERGSVTIEHVIWAVAVIAIVGIVVAAVRAYVTTQAGNIN